MDSQGRITWFNPAAEATFGYRREEVIGELLGETLVPPAMRERHRLGLAHLLATGEGPILGHRIEINGLRGDGREFPVELTVTQLPDTDPPLFIGYARDLTAIRQFGAELTAGRERLAHIVRTLQASLLPPGLPDIDGYEVAAAFRAMGGGYEVGGDFYDVFQLNHPRWALTLGDVSGKGSEAAVVTALARYTLRAAAMRNSNPTSVLSTLNEAIHRQHPEQFCTAVCAILDPSTNTVEFALGGHPHPLILSTDGGVRWVGTSNLLLGPRRRWHGGTTTLTLRPGDALVLYSDGLTEARSGPVFFGDDRLFAAAQSATGRSAAETVEHIEATALDFAGELSDDLAILVLRRLP